MVELLGETDLSQTQRDYVETIRESSRLLLRIINDVLDLSKLEAGKTRLEFHPVNLCRVLDSVAASFHAATEEKGIRLLLHCDDAIPPLMMIDEFRLRQVLTNLIDNAVKFTMQGRVELRAVVQRAHKAVRASVLRGNISVKTGLMDEASHTVDVTFHVTDTGIGMSEDQKARIFEKFEQADSSTTRKFGGTGLGLTICRELIGLMGGRLSVQTSQGVGSDFSFTLPFRIAQVDHEYEDALRTESSDTFRARASAEYATSPEPPSQPQPQSPAAEDVARERETPPRAPAPTGKLAEARFQSLTILLAEDNKINQLVAQRMLREFGCEVEVASDGEEALAVARDRHFDIILMDCHMPVMDGYRATREIRHRGGASQHVPIIALTASALADDRQRCLEAGMDDFISKPVTLEDLKRILIRHGVKEEATEAEIEKKEQH